MKKLSFYVMALAFCVLLVGAVAVSSPIEAGAFDTVGSAYVDVHMGDYNMVGLLTTSTNPSEPGGDAKAEYWTVSQTGEVEAYTGAGAPDASSYMHIGKSNDGSTIVLTLHNVAPERDVFYIEAGNTNVEIVLEGENILRGDYTYESDAALQARNFGLPYDAPAPSLTISGSGTLACYGADIVVESEESGPIHEEMTRASGDEENYLSYGIYAEGDFTVKAGATVTGIGGDIDVEEADMAESHGLYAEGGVTVKGTLIAEGGNVLTEDAGYVYSSGIYDKGGFATQGNAYVTAEGGSAKISSGDAVVASSNSVGIFAHDNVSIAAGSTVKATGGAAEAYTEDTTSLIVSSCGIETSADEAVINGRVEAAGGTAKGSNSNPITCRSYGLFISQFSIEGTDEDEVPELTVNGTLDATAADTEAAATGERGDAEAYSYAVYVLGDVIIGDNAVVTATGGRADSTAEQRGAYAESAGIYVFNSDNFTVGKGASVTAKGGDVTGDGDGNANNGADSYGIYVCEDGGSTDGIKGVIAGDVIAAGGKATGTNETLPASYGLDAHSSKLTVSGTLLARGGKTNGVSFGVASKDPSGDEEGPDIILKDGCWLIAAGDNYALTNTSYGGAEDYNITLPETYRWRTSADSAFTASGTEPYTFSANHTYVEIAPVSVAAESVTVEPGTLELEVSETGGLSAVIVPSIATDTVTWSSSDEGVASVGADGTVTGVAPGTAVITVTAGNASATCTVTVTAAGPEPTPTPGGPDINVGPVYEIELDEDIRGGAVSTSLARASAGSTIRVTATPDEGWELLYVTVDGERIEGMSFKMPAHDVTVSAVFAGDLPFADVDEGAWYAEAVRWAASEGVVEGVSDTEFAPDDTVTREQLAAILWRYAGEPATAADLNGYADGASVSGWAVTAMSWAVENMIITGSDGGLLSPLSGATRAQCAAILARFMEL